MLLKCWQNMGNTGHCEKNVGQNMVNMVNMVNMGPMDALQIAPGSPEVPPNISISPKPRKRMGVIYMKPPPPPPPPPHKKKKSNKKKKKEEKSI